MSEPDLSVDALIVEIEQELKRLQGRRPWLPPSLPDYRRLLTAAARALRAQQEALERLMQPVEYPTCPRCAVVLNANGTCFCGYGSTTLKG